jgi:ketosteroid isomerase-like protein
LLAATIRVATALIGGDPRTNILDTRRIVAVWNFDSSRNAAMNTLELDHQLNALIIQGKSADAFEAFYAEDVVAQENDEPERVGRQDWMQARKEMEKNIKKFEARVLASAATGDTSFSEWEYTIDIEGMGTIRIAQVSVRRWKDGKVIRERFYHR